MKKVILAVAMTTALSASVFAGGGTIGSDTKSVRYGWVPSLGDTDRVTVTIDDSKLIESLKPSLNDLNYYMTSSLNGEHGSFNSGASTEARIAGSGICLGKQANCENISYRVYGNFDTGHLLAVNGTMTTLKYMVEKTNLNIVGSCDSVGEKNPAAGTVNANCNINHNGKVQLLVTVIKDIKTGQWPISNVEVIGKVNSADYFKSYGFRAGRYDFGFTLTTQAK